MERTFDMRAVREDEHARGFDRLRESRLRPWLSLLLAGVVVVAICLVQTPKYALPDDFIQDLYVRGAYFDTPSYLMLYSLVAFSAPVSALYALLPSVPWFPLVMLAMVAVSFAIVLDMALSARLPVGVTIFLSGALLACEACVTMYFTYTIVAFVATAGGLALIMRHGAFERPERFRAGDVLAYVLVVEGFSLRPESGIAALAIFAPFLFWAIARNRNARTFAMAAGVVAAMGISSVAGLVAWHTAEGWEEFEQTFHAAQAVADYPEVSYDDVAALGLDLSETDMEMLYEFLFVDADTYSLEVFEELGSIVEGYGLSSVVETAVARPTYTAFAVGLDAVLFVVAGLVCAARRYRGGARVLTFSVPAMATLNLAYLFLRARPKMHVILPIFVVGLMALVACCLVPEPDPAPAGRHAAVRAEDGSRTPGTLVTRVLPAGGMAVFLAIAVLVQVKYVQPLRASLAAEVTPAAQAYVSENADQLVLFTQTQGVLMNYDIFTFESWDHPGNAVFIGGYEYYTAAWDTFLEENGLDREGFLLNLIDAQDMVTVSYAYQAELIAAYLTEHAGIAVEAELVEGLGYGTQSTEEICVWRYVAS